MPLGFTGVSCSLFSVSFQRGVVAWRASQGRVEEAERVRLVVCDDAPGVGGTSWKRWAFRPVEIFGKEQVVDLFLERSVVRVPVKAGAELDQKKHHAYLMIQALKPVPFVVCCWRMRS